MKTPSRISAYVALVVFLVVAGFVQPVEAQKRPKNIILFITDGLGPAGYTMTRDYARDVLGRPYLTVDPYLVGSSRTRSTSNRVTDSAAGATAYSAGQKTYNGAIGVDVNKKPIPTILEAAEARGMATGIVSTSRVTHATPASFTAHVPDRDMEAEIALQQSQLGVDVIFGGGKSFYLPKEQGGKRTDGKNLIEVMRASGTQIVEKTADLNGNLKAPVLGLFAPDHMSYDIDRDSTAQPSLVQMTRKAIDLLKGDKDGFFLMVEASEIDFAGHGNDAAALVNDVLAFDKAIAAAIEFARKDGNTLVVSVSDHETGGLTIGVNYQWNPQVLSKVQSSTEQLVAAIAKDPARQNELIQSKLGITDLNEKEQALLKEAGNKTPALQAAINKIIATRASIGWSHGGHTGVDVNLYAYGPSREKLVGSHENSEVGQTLAQLLGLNLNSVRLADLQK